MFKKIKRLSFLLILLILISEFLVLPKAANNANGGVRPYYSGDAVTFASRIFIITANMGEAEIFELANDKLALINSFKPYDALYEGSPDFIDAVFNLENGRLYAYLTNGEYIYKYDLAQPDEPVLAGQTSYESGDRFASLNVCGGNLTSVGVKGIKIWNHDLQFFYQKEIANSVAENIQLDPSCNYIFNVNQDRIEIFNRADNHSWRPVKIELNYNHDRKILFGDYKQNFYLVDDQAIKKYDYEGNVVMSFSHISTRGYSAMASIDPRYLYFSDGLGIVKLFKENLEPIDWVYTTDLAGADGWATNFHVVQAPEGEKVIVFNKNSILVLNENLDLIDSYASIQPGEAVPEGAYFTVDRGASIIGEWLTMDGQGFLPHEDIKITLAGNSVYFLADAYGNFNVHVETPAVAFGTHDLSAEGLFSHRLYSIKYSINRMSD